MNKRNILVKILKILCYASFIIGIYFTYALFFGNLDPISGSIGMITGQSAGYLSFIFLSITLILLKFKNKQKNPRTYYTILIIGLIISGSFLLPIILTPVSVSNGNGEFEEAFGKNWKNNIPQEVEDQYTQSTFNLSRYFLGKPNKNCTIKRDIKYYENEGITLYYDVYLPPKNKKNLPGNRSTIIKIHGGAWMVGDKGIGNMIPNSKYLASQGYVVFDIQYGLRDTVNFLDFVKFKNPDGRIAPSHKVGDFTVKDQVRHIGIFSKKLESTYGEKYNADLNSVYIMGGSAGGHLSSVFGMGYNENYFENTFSENLNIKGIVPIYPAVDAERYFNFYMPELLENNPKTNPKLYKYYDPSKIVDKNDPPALIFQGTSDGLAPPNQTKKLEKAMEDNNLKCCRILFPLAGHANDFLNNSNFTQVWTYYLERFLYLTQ